MPLRSASGAGDRPATAELRVWHGRIDWTDVRNQHHSTWVTERVPVGETPWTWPDMPWHMAKIWLPHSPVRGRAK